MLALAILFALGVALAAGGAVFRRHERSRRPLAVLPIGVAPSSVSFLDDGRLVAVVLQDGSPDWIAEIWSVDEGRLVHSIHAGDKRPLVELLQLASRAALIGLGDEHQLRVLSATTGREVARIAREPEGSQGVLSPRGDLVASIDSSGRTVVRKTRDGGLAFRLEPAPGMDTPRSHSTPFFAADEAFIAQHVFATEGRHGLYRLGVVIYSLADGSIACLTSRHVAGFTRRDELVARDSGFSGGKPSYTFEAVSLDGSAVRKIVIAEDLDSSLLPSGSPNFALYRRTIAEIVVCSIDTGEVVRRVALGPRVVHGFDLSPEGDRLAIGYKDGVVEVWSVPP